MASKVTLINLSKVDSTITNDLNTNFTRLADAIDDALDRNGTSPNQMEDDLDMNNFAIRNIRTDIDNPSGIASQSRLDDEEEARKEADANLQTQLTGDTPLEASAFSEISWHGQTVENSVTIPEDKNAWSFGPTVTIASGQQVDIGSNSFWTIAHGDIQ